MNILFLLLIPVALLLAFAGTVLFWASFSQLRFLSYFRNHEPRPPDLGLSGWIAFYWRTLKGAFVLLGWTLRGAFRSRLQQPDGPVRGRSILCVHGLFLNDTTLWGIRKRLHGIGRPTRAIFMGLPFPSPMAYVGPLTRAMQEMADRSPDEGFEIVAHSIGGVMTREVLRRNPHLAPSIHRVVTLGSPHHGTAAARWLRFGPIYRMLGLGSEYLQGLPDFRTLAPRAAVTTLATQHDLVVYPVTVSHLEGAHPVTLNKVSHLGLLTESPALDEIQRAFSQPTL
jgi:triacylglycerol lipase